MEHHRFADQRENGKSYVEFLRTQDLSVGVYRLPTGAVDSQHPHGEEEVYYVVAGKSRFRAGDRDVSVRAGDLLLVSAKEPHQFHDIEEDLELLVFFAPPEGSRK